MNDFAKKVVPVQEQSLMADLNQYPMQDYESTPMKAQLSARNESECAEEEAREEKPQTFQEVKEMARNVLKQFDKKGIKDNAVELVHMANPIKYSFKGEELTDEGRSFKLKKLVVKNPFRKCFAMLFFLLSFIKLVVEFSKFGSILTYKEFRRPYQAWSPMDERQEIRENCALGDCSDYRGTLSRTRYGEECMHWSLEKHKSFPMSGLGYDEEHDEPDGETNNYCRNPDRDK